MIDSWHKITLTGRDAQANAFNLPDELTGRQLALRTQGKLHKDSRLSVVCQSTDYAPEHIILYFSPVASKIHQGLVAQLKGILWAQPLASEVKVLVGGQAALDELLHNASSEVD